MKKIVYLVCLVCALSASSYGQKAPEQVKPAFTVADSVSMNLLNSSDYIFEARIIGEQTYYNDDSSKILSSWKVQISKVYKGNLKEGTVEMIMEGGQIGLDDRIIMHRPSFGYGVTYIFLCKESDYKSKWKQNFDNPVKLSFINDYMGFIEYSYSLSGKFMPVGLNDVGFKSKADMENTLSQIKGVKIIKDPVPPSPKLNYTMPRKFSQQEFMAVQQSRFAIGKANRSIMNTLSNNEFTLTLANEKLTKVNNIEGDMNQNYEFDIMIKANNSFIYFCNAGVMFDYNIQTFGESIADSVTR